MREPVEVPDAEYEQLVARVAAIDVAKSSGKVCVRVPHETKPGGRVSKVWGVDATRRAVLELADHLVCEGIEVVTVESTSDYWRIFFYVLVARCLPLPLVNARDVKNEKLPAITSMLADLAKPFPEPGWLQVAYSLLSQITHATPLGLIHSIRWGGETWNGNELSPEMLGLALDVACLSSALLIGTSAVVLTSDKPAAIEYRKALGDSALKVHSAGRLVHGLD